MTLIFTYTKPIDHKYCISIIKLTTKVLLLLYHYCKTGKNNLVQVFIFFAFYAIKDLAKYCLCLLYYVGARLALFISIVKIFGLHKSI